MDTTLARTPHWCRCLRAPARVSAESAGDARARGEEVVLEAGEAAAIHGRRDDGIRSRQGQTARLLPVRLVLTGHPP
jgi:hypothetical protein